MTIDQSDARRWATRLLEENCENDASYEFNRWLAAHDREVAEKAWDEGFMRANRLVNCRMCRGTTVPKINPYTV